MRWGGTGRDGRGGEGAGRQGRGEPRQGYEIFQEPPTQGWFPTNAVAQLWQPEMRFLAAKETLIEIERQRERKRERTENMPVETTVRTIRVSFFFFPLFFV